MTPDDHPHSSSTPGIPEPEPEPRTDLIAYGVAVVGLIVLGVFVRTPILNWIIGPAFVVAVVTLLGPRLERWRK